MMMVEIVTGLVTSIDEGLEEEYKWKKMDRNRNEDSN